jgi:hypothetical protein
LTLPRGNIVTRNVFVSGELPYDPLVLADRVQRSKSTHRLHAAAPYTALVQSANTGNPSQIALIAAIAALS